MLIGNGQVPFPDSEWFSEGFQRLQINAKCERGVISKKLFRTAGAAPSAERR
jgi:hypothetical protein